MGLKYTPDLNENSFNYNYEDAVRKYEDSEQRYEEACFDILKMHNHTLRLQMENYRLAGMLKRIIYCLDRTDADNSYFRKQVLEDDAGKPINGDILEWYKQQNKNKKI